MAFVLADRVRETTTTTGTGTVTLGGAVTGFQSFSAIGNANNTYYAIAGQGTAEWEVGIGTYTASGTTLSRDTVLASSNAGSLVVFSAGTKDVFCDYPAAKALAYSTTGTVDLIGTTSIDVSSSTAALRVTQRGTGNALLIEDSTNPDSTPFVVDDAGVLISAHTSSTATQTGTARIEAAANAGFSAITSGTTATNAGNIDLSRSRGTASARTIVSSGDSVGRVSYGGYDGAAFIELAKIEGAVDGTPGTNDMPGRLVFSTTADGASTPTERLRINSSGTTIASGEVQAPTVNATNGLFVNSATISANYTIPSGSNAGSFGPVSVASGISVTVPSGSVWTVV